MNTSFFQDLDPYFTTTPDTNSNTSPQYTAQTGFQNTAPLISSSANPAPNTWHGGVWSRGGYADNTIDSTISGGGNLASTNSSVQTQLSGFQVGIDGGLYNIQNSRMNVVVGLMGGEVFANSSSVGASAQTNVPFIGGYAALTGKGFTGIIQIRHDQFDMTLDNPDLAVVNQKLNANGMVYSGEASYVFPLPNNFFVEPSGALYVSRINIDNEPLPAFATPVVASFDEYQSTLGRLGLRGGELMTVGDITLQPYASASVWHEFQGQTTANVALFPSITGTPVGTFGQFTLGLASQVPKLNITSYIRVDAREGEDIHGWGLTAGARYSF